MMSLFSTWGNHWRAVVCTLWIIALSALLLTQKYSIFLRPEFGILLGLGILVLAGFLIYGCFASQPRPLGPLEIIRGCILLIPLIYLLNSGDKLNSSAFKNRFLGPVATATDTTEDVSPPTAGTYCAKPGGCPPVASVSSSASRPETGGIKKATLLDLTIAPQQYTGKSVAVMGMLTQSDEYNKIFKGDFLLLFRFNVTCCAADSMPVYALLQGNNLPELPEDTWVEARGRFEMRNVDGYRIPMIDGAVMDETTAPDPPYLY